AEQELQSVLINSPRDSRVVKLLAETRLRQLRPEEALSTLKVVEDAMEQDSQIGFLMGRALLAAGNVQQGAFYLEHAASLDPSNELLKVQVARAYLAAGREADAANLIEHSFAGGSSELHVRLLQLFADIRLGTSDSPVVIELMTTYSSDPRALTAVAIYSQL